jgi:hypothetical protein
VSAGRLPPAHRGTTAHLQALYPFMAEGGLGLRRVYIGREVLGGAFCFDPWDAYAEGLVTNPNLVVIGQIGRGKSTFIKTWLWRERLFSRQCWVLDPKGEYGALARACGVEPLCLGPGLPLRLNPLDPGGTGGGAEQRQSELLASVAAASLGRPLLPPERAACDVALAATRRQHHQPTLPAVVAALLRPDPAAAAVVGTDAAGLAVDGRDVALELRRLVHGDLAGMFDGPTSPGIDLGAPVVVVDLSRLYASPALGVLMTCAAAWLQSATARSDGAKRLVVIDEAWAILHDLSIARWLQASFKLSRAFGVANVVVLHRLSDLRAAGHQGSQQQRLAEGLLADSECRVVFGQPPGEAAEAAGPLGLTRTEVDLLPQLPRGTALWRIGTRSFVVEHAVGADERAFVDTDSAMLGAIPVAGRGPSGGRPTRWRRAAR